MLTPRQQHCLKGIGIQQWVGRSAGKPAQEVVPAVESIGVRTEEITRQDRQEIPVVEAPAPPKLDTWDNITRSIHQCEACELSQNCTQKVPGVGSQQAGLMIIGEGPGHE